jgi:large subunit ribosomal protein L10
MATALKKAVKVDKKAQKAESIEAITERLKRSSTAVLADYRGMTVAQMQELRNRLRADGVEMLVVKNTLARRAAKAAGYGDLEKELTGPIAMVFAAEDVSGPARAVRDYFVSTRKMAIRAGLLEGRVIDGDTVGELADLPSREVLIARLLGSLQSPVANLANVLQAPLSKLARTLDAVREQKEKTAPAGTPAAA